MKTKTTKSMLTCGTILLCVVALGQFQDTHAQNINSDSRNSIVKIAKAVKEDTGQQDRLNKVSQSNSDVMKSTVSPLKISTSTGWYSTFNKLEDVSPGTISADIKATNFLSGGIGAQFESQFTIDQEIANQLFSVSDWKNYITGTISCPGGLWGKTINIQDALSKAEGSADSVSYSSRDHRLVFDTQWYLIDLGINQSIEWKVNINMDAFHKNHPDKLVTKKSQYTFATQTYNKDISINLPNNGSQAYLDYPGNEDWIHADVPTTSIDVNAQNIISGQLEKNDVKEYDSYAIDLTLNGVAIANNLSVDKNGAWKIDGTKYKLKSGDILKAQVTGKRSNGEVAYSNWTTKQLGEDIPYEKWTVNSPILIQPVDGDTSVKLDLPDQNCQLERSYDYVVSVNGVEKAKGNYNGLSTERGLLLPGTTLKEKDLVSVKIVGHQSGKADKESQSVQLVVGANSDHPYDTWKVLPATIKDVKSGESSVAISVPSQDSYNGRSYSMNTYVNNKLINTKDIKISGGNYSIPYTDGQGSIKTFKVDDKIKVVIVGHQDTKEDKLSVDTETVVKDGSDYNTWNISAPKVKDNLYSDDKMVTVSVPNEDQNYDRTYSLEVLVDGKLSKTVSVPKFESNMDVALDQGLKTGQKVTAVLVGHQPDHANKSSDVSNEVNVKDSNANWNIAKASIAPMTDKDKAVSITAPKLSDENGRTYEVVISVNGVEKTKQAINSTQTIQIPLTVKKDDVVSAYIVGHQPDHDDKNGESSQITVSHKAAQTHTSFKRVYWQNYGYVYEGTINNPDIDMSDANKLKETINVLDASGNTIKQVSATPADWDGNKVNNGFQFILDNETLSSLNNGKYSFQINVSAEGVDYGTSDLNISTGLGSGRYHDNYTDLEEVDFNSKIVSPLIENNKPEITISSANDSDNIHVVNKYWNDSIQLVFDGYVGDGSGKNSNSITKNLEIKDKSGNIVYQKNNLATIDTSWGADMGVHKEATFQAIVPYEYSIESDYTYTLIVKDASGKTITTDNLK